MKGRRFVHLSAAALLCAVVLTACGQRLPELPAEPAVYARGDFQPAGEESGYATVEKDGKVFIPYGVLRSRGLFSRLTDAFGPCLGYVEGDEADRIYALAGADTDVWLIEYYTAGVMENPVVLREVGSRGAETPAGVESLGYDYWK